MYCFDWAVLFGCDDSDKLIKSKLGSEADITYKKLLRANQNVLTFSVSTYPVSTQYCKNCIAITRSGNNTYVAPESEY